jgi:hypothetical protein
MRTRNTPPTRRLEIALRQTQRWQDLLTSQPTAAPLLRRVWQSQIEYWQHQAQSLAHQIGA